MPEAVIVSAVRTPVGKAFKGSLRATRPDDLAALAIKEALARVPGLDAKEIDDVILGCAMPEGEQGMNVARIAALRAGREFKAYCLGARLRLFPVLYAVKCANEAETLNAPRDCGAERPSGLLL